jgi:diadenosine tetraphosphate (Ap4A) HIT family hydrolase
MSASLNSDCLICDMETVDESYRIFRDELWACEIVPGFEVPGWFVLRVRRHAERLTGLNNTELELLAYRAHDVVAAVTTVTGAPATYFMVFGENHPHFHALVAARGDDVPEHRRNGDILKLREEYADPTAAAKLVPAIRAAYLPLAAARTAPVASATDVDTNDGSPDVVDQIS